MKIQPGKTELQKIRQYPIFVALSFTLILFLIYRGSNYFSPKMNVQSSQPALGEPSVEQFNELHGGDDISPALRAEMTDHVNESVARLQAQNILPKTFAASPVQFMLPIRTNADTYEYSYYAISNYVDHNPLVGGQLQDYRCGDLTYDAADGYNHSGTDYMPFPFPWQKMDRNEVQVIAAASGIIVDKQDGYFDSECVAQEKQGNTIVLQHEDGTKTWYLHMKNGSLLSKSIGEEVAVGEYLGVIGSSGRSSGPHLHFEITDRDDNLIDPFFDASNATCNTTANETRWVNQRPYDRAGINDIVLSAVRPQFPFCQKAILAERTTFAPGEEVVFNLFYRNDSVDKQTEFVLYDPSGTAVTNWTHSPTETHAAGAAWSFPLTLPEAVPFGEWALKVTYEGREYEEGFVVAASVAVTPSPTVTYTPVPTRAPATDTPIAATPTITAISTASPTTIARPTATATQAAITIPTRSASSPNNMIYLPAVTN